MDSNTLKTPAGRLTEAGVKKILDLRRTDQLTYQEIAAVMGCSLGTVYNCCKGNTHPHLTR